MMKRTQTMTGGQIAKYFLLPGVMPRLQELLGSGFVFISVFLAQIYGAARLLPAGHPYLNTANAGKFTIRQVVSAAAARLEYKRENIDQIIIFFILLSGLVILALQFLSLGIALMAGAAHAATAITEAMPTSFSGFFTTNNPTDDVAFVLMDRVFGVPNFFNSCVEQNTACFTQFNANNTAEGSFPWPYHKGLQAMLGFYSTGLLVIGVLIFCYFIFAVVAETAQTGTPFGRRFSQVWAPLRMVAALGLLIPLPNGFNAAQYILLYAAKYGSGFATNGWTMFTNQMNDTDADATLAGAKSNLIATPTSPDPTKLLEFFTVAQACRASYEVINNEDIKAYMVHDTRDAINRQEVTQDVTYADALKFYANQDIMIRFGSCRSQDPDLETSKDSGVDCADGIVGDKPIYDTWEGYVKPYCGEIILPVTGAVNEESGPGAYAIQEGYFNMVKNMWLGGTSPDADEDKDCSKTTPAASDTDTSKGGIGNDPWMRHWGYCFVDLYGTFTDEDNGVDAPDKGNLESLLDGGRDPEDDPTGGYRKEITDIIANGVTKEVANNNWAYSMQGLGWAGAGIWYNKIAQMNGALITAAANLPHIIRYPMPMEDVSKARHKVDNKVTARDQYKPAGQNGEDLDLPDGEKELVIAKVLSPAFSIWDDMYPKSTGMTFDDFFKVVFGDQNLFNLRDPKNANVHPLALLAGLGDSLINVATGTLFFATLASVPANVLGEGDESGFGKLAGGVASLLTSIGGILIGVGFVLYYVVPFLPFLYFFFAVGGWIKGIFEAMVGVPLWALAHIRIDGEGFTGPSAASGYFMILEIFLRPILIVFGLLLSVTLFAAQVYVLNDIWDLVTSNLTGFDMTSKDAGGAITNLADLRDHLDQFFFTVIYAFMVYMLGTASFKLITFLPSEIMRWMGSGVKAFTDEDTDPAGQLVSGITTAGSIGSNIGVSGVQKAGSQGRAAYDRLTPRQK